MPQMNPTRRQRLQQACVAGLACLLALSLVAVTLTGRDSLVPALPLLLAIAAAAAALAASRNRMGVARTILLGGVVALVGCAALLAYAVMRI